MIKTKTIETVEEFDENGKLVKKTTTEQEETDDSPIKYSHTSTPFFPAGYKDIGFFYNQYPSPVCSEGKRLSLLQE